MNDPTAENILKNTFDYLEEVLEEQNHHKTTGKGGQLAEDKSSDKKQENKGAETVRDNCCSA